MHIVLRDVHSILPYVRNPRVNKAAVAKVAASIKAFGFKQAIVVDKDNTIVVGHTRWLAAQQLGLKQVPILVADDLSPTAIKAYRLADNRTAQEASWDQALLGLEVSDLSAAGFDTALTGFDLAELQILQALHEAVTVGKTDPDVCADSFEAPRCQLGELWHLGRHRLLCGDATSNDDVERLMGGEQAALGFSDPPYNVDYEGRTDKKLTLAGDHHVSEAHFEEFLEQIFVSYQQVLHKTSSLYVCHASLYQRSFQNALEKAGFTVRNVLIWAKQHFSLSRGRYKYQHEPIYYCHHQGVSDAWYGDHAQSTLWSIPKPSANRLHPTMKPVALIERALLNSSQPGNCVVDLLAGSGSTLMACEPTGRIAYLMEIDPQYCDAILSRWEAFTGQTAVLASACAEKRDAIE
jgi:DNA modification methylase